MPVDYTEKGFEQAIQAHLQAHGYTISDLEHFSPRLAMDPTILASFLKDTQSEEWNRLTGLYGSDADRSTPIRARSTRVTSRFGHNGSGVYLTVI